MARPELLVFDVNETLSDLSPMARRFSDVGASAELARPWFAGVLRDGLALTVCGDSERFATLAEANARRELLVTAQRGELDRDLDEAVRHILAGFVELPVHDDVPDGVRSLAGLGIRLVTLSNGAASVARTLLSEAGLAEHFEHLLSVEDVGIWKPAARAYAHALETCAVAAARAVLVAVHPWDVDGARRAGMGTAWLNRDDREWPAYLPGPDHEATSLTQLAGLLT